MKKVMFVILALVMAFCVGCSDKQGDEPFACIKESYARIPIVDWGTSYDDTLKLLNLKENNVEIVHANPVANGRDYKLVVVEKLKLGGQNISAVLYFYDEAENEKLGFDMGLTSARIFCETKETAQAIAKQLTGTESGVIIEDTLTPLISSQKLIDVVKEKNVEAQMITAISDIHKMDEASAKAYIEDTGTSVMKVDVSDEDESFFEKSEKMKGKSFDTMFIFNGGEGYAILNHITG